MSCFAAIIISEMDDDDLPHSKKLFLESYSEDSKKEPLALQLSTCLRYGLQIRSLGLALCIFRKDRDNQFLHKSVC